MSWWKRKKCPLCKSVLKKKHKTAEFRIDTAEGVLELEVCMGCATIMDHSADILMGKPRGPYREEPLDLGEYEEVHRGNDS